MKPLIIGQAPGRTGDPADPLNNPKLSRLLGLPHEEYLEAFERRNLIDRYPGPRGGGPGAKGDYFPLSEARHNASKVDLKGRYALLLGKGVAQAFRLGNMPFFVYVPWRGGIVAVAPHPSGISLFYNDKRNVDRAQQFLRDWAWRATHNWNPESGKPCQICGGRGTYKGYSKETQAIMGSPLMDWQCVFPEEDLPCPTCSKGAAE